MKGKLLWATVLLGIVLLLGLAWSVLFSPSDESDNAPAPKGNRSASREVDVCDTRGGKAEHIYNLSFVNKANETLVIEKVEFSGLDTTRAEVSVSLRYEGTRPPWSEKPSSFVVEQPGRSEQLAFREIGPVRRIAGSNSFGQRLSGLFVNPEDVGTSTPGVEPEYEIFLAIKGFIPKKSLGFGLLAPTDCPIGSGENLVGGEDSGEKSTQKTGQKSNGGNKKKPKKSKAQAKGKKAKAKKAQIKSKKQKKQG